MDIHKHTFIMFPWTLSKLTTFDRAWVTFPKLLFLPTPSNFPLKYMCSKVQTEKGVGVEMTQKIHLRHTLLNLGESMHNC